MSNTQLKCIYLNKPFSYFRLLWKQDFKSYILYKIREIILLNPIILCTFV